VVSDLGTVYSHSRIGTFEQCPRKYRFRYIDRIRIDIEPVETFLGSRVHESLEHLYRCRLNGRLLSEEEVLAFYDAEWARRWHPAIRIVHDHLQAEDYRNVGRECLSAYYRRYHPFQDGRILGVERRIFVRLDPEGRYRLQGFIDRIDKVADGVFEIHDYKTNATLPTQEEKDNDRQLALYEIGLRDMFPRVEEVALVWHYLRFDEEIRSQRTGAQLDALRNEVLGQVQGIESAVQDGEMPAVESKLCSWCEYRRLCPLWRHLYQVEEVVEGEGHSGADGVALVNRLAEVVAKRQALSHQDKCLKEEKESLERAILRYANEHGLGRVFGSEYEATISERTEWRLPTRRGDHEKYDALDAVLRESDAWVQVSELSRKGLNEWLASEESGPLRDRIVELMDRHEVSRVSLRKRGA
jgi:putative RecB family exonuclease